MERKCYNHPERYPVGTCRYCGRSLCSECLVTGKGYYHCKNEDDCLAFQEKGADARPIPMKKEPIVEAAVDEKTLAEVAVEKTKLRDEGVHQPLKERGLNYYARIFRKPRSVRDAVVITEILTRRRFKRP